MDVSRKHDDTGDSLLFLASAHTQRQWSVEGGGPYDVNIMLGRRCTVSRLPWSTVASHATCKTRTRLLL